MMNVNEITQTDGHVEALAVHSHRRHVSAQQGLQSAKGMDITYHLIQKS